MKRKSKKQKPKTRPSERTTGMMNPFELPTVPRFPNEIMRRVAIEQQREEERKKPYVLLGKRKD